MRLACTRATVLAIGIAACVTSVSAAAPGWATRDAAHYAMAACLAGQRDATLKDQGQAWAAAIVQRGPGNPAALRAIDAAVRAEVARGEVPIARDEEHPMAGKPLFVMWCVQMADRPTVRAAITRAVSRRSAR